MKKDKKTKSAVEETRKWRKMVFENEGLDFTLVLIGIFFSLFGSINGFRDLIMLPTWIDWVQIALYLFVLIFFVFVAVKKYRNYKNAKKQMTI